ncbi:MAG: AAA family ATPase [Gemmataceae bacterium]|nr:AAA family ATPase [Gemmataceae bacterium]MDW8265357.1 AAA family ATPase [Gemmataceae bacterium]
MLYEAHFGLRRRPFATTADGKFWYPATSHQQALTRLLQGLENDEEVLLLTGTPGTGKTALARFLMDKLSPGTIALFLSDCRFRTRLELYQTLAHELGLEWERTPEQELKLRCIDAIDESARAGRRTIVVADEAQHLPSDLLEEWRLIGNLQGPHGKLVRTILVGWPILLQALRQDVVVGLDQRVVTRTVLEPLGRDEAIDFLVHHVRLAGGQPSRLFTDEALAMLAQASGGLPRRLAQLGHRALMVAHAAETQRVDAEVAHEAITSLPWDVELPKHSDPTEPDREPPDPDEPQDGDVFVFEVGSKEPAPATPRRNRVG